MSRVTHIPENDRGQPRVYVTEAPSLSVRRVEIGAAGEGARDRIIMTPEDAIKAGEALIAWGERLGGKR